MLRKEDDNSLLLQNPSVYSKAEEADEDIHSKKAINSKHIYLYAASMSVGSIQYGIPQILPIFIGILGYVTMTGTYLYINSNGEQDDVLSRIDPIIVAIGGLIGAFISGFLVQKGRRKTLMTTNLLIIGGCLLQAILFPIGTATTQSFKASTGWHTLLFICRAFLGVPAGIYSMLVPLIIKEMSPIEIFGSVGAFHQIMITFGNFLGFLIHYSYGLTKEEDITYYTRYISFLYIVLIIPIIFSGVQLYLLIRIFRNETPKFYYFSDQKEESEKALQKIYKSKQRINMELLELMRSFEDDRRRNLHWRELFRTMYLRAFLVGCVILGILAELSGINYVNFYANIRLFAMFQIPKVTNTLNLLLGLAGLIASCLTLLAALKIGRRPLFLSGTLIMAISLFSMALLTETKKVQEQEDDTLYCIIITILVFLDEIAYQFSLGTMGWIYIAEILPSKGIAVCTTLHWVFMSVSFIPTLLIFAYGETTNYQNFFYFYGAVMIAGFFFILALAKETKGHTDKEIKTLFLPEGCNTFESTPIMFHTHEPLN